MSRKNYENPPYPLRPDGPYPPLPPTSGSNRSQPESGGYLYDYSQKAANAMKGFLDYSGKNDKKERELRELELEQQRIDAELRRRADERERKKRLEAQEDERRRERMRRQNLEKDARFYQQLDEDKVEQEAANRRAEEQRNQLNREHEKSLESQKDSLRKEYQREAQFQNASFDDYMSQASEKIREREEDRIRTSNLQKQEISQIREETKKTVENYARELEETRRRQEREAAELEEELRRIEEQNRAAREKQREMWEDRSRKMKEQLDYVMKQMAHKQWTIVMERNFETRLSFLRSAGKTIRSKFEYVADSLITFQSYLKETAEPDENRSRLLKARTDELRSVLEKQQQVMEDEVENLETMYQKRPFKFLPDIQDSLKEVVDSCSEMREEVMNNYLIIDTDYVKSGDAIRTMNELFDKVARSYSKIPTMDSLKSKYEQEEEQGESSSRKEENQDGDGQVFFIEEPED